MTPEEKWNRLNNPKTAEDYGLSLSEEELMSFPEARDVILMSGLQQIILTGNDSLLRSIPEGRAFLCEMAKDRRKMSSYYRAVSKNIGDTIDSIILECIKKGNSKEFSNEF